MSNLAKIQKVMKVCSVFAKIVLGFVAISAILFILGAVLVATGVFSEQNEFMNIISSADKMSKTQFIGMLSVSAMALVFQAVHTVFVCAYFKAELTDGTPFTFSGAKRVLKLGIMQIVFAVLSNAVMGGVYSALNIATPLIESIGSVTFGICLILLSLALNYGAELEQKVKKG